MTHYQLTFATDGGSRRSIRVADIDPNLSPQDLQAAVDLLLAHDIMDPERGALTGLLKLTANTVNITNPLA
ncbi:MAG: DUF2922 family protein [Defluviitaleaceae bacterium]|nr:DUF2922 family protein [Defluviitaleaceae bacterium]